MKYKKTILGIVLVVIVVGIYLIVINQPTIKPIVEKNLSNMNVGDCLPLADTNKTICLLQKNKTIEGGNISEIDDVVGGGNGGVSSAIPPDDVIVGNKTKVNITIC